MKRLLLLTAMLLGLASIASAHSGKARFHVLIDTDGAADDLRTLCLLLGNREVEVLAVTTSSGALTPDRAARKVASLTRSLYHEGVPVGVGRAVRAPAPAWRAHSEEVAWGEAPDTPQPLPAAAELICETLRDEEEKVFFIALGALTNMQDALAQDPSLAARFDRILWYNDSAQPLAGANYAADPEAARSVLASGIPVYVVSAAPARPLLITPALLDSIAAIPTPYAARIVRTHRAEPLARLVRERHLQAWDELAAVCLFRPELFAVREVGGKAGLSQRGAGGQVFACTLSDGAVGQAEAEIVAILRGKPDAENRVFYDFPVRYGDYAPDVAAIIDTCIARHGLSEWRAGVLTNELHGHLGIYATVGVKMGIRAREYFNIGVDDIEVLSYAGSKPPVSCMNDGLQVSTGATVGHGLIRVAERTPPRPEARFSFKGKTIRLALKPEYAERIRRDVARGIELHGDLTEPYWLYVRGLALAYWRDFDRHELFDLYVEQPGGLLTAR
ncbi:nucleoside hydrolase [Alistipes sp.]|uniref:nucleoside hydrolase n=1 Tax=Alistipes sp. TaxID=1872444 RepID=UPI003AF11EA4